MAISKLAILKGVAELSITAGVGVIVGNLVRATTPVESSRITKILVTIGGYGLTGVLGDLSGKYVANQIDTYGNKFKDLLHPIVEEAEEIGEALTEDAKEAVNDVKSIVNKKSIAEQENEGADDHANLPNRKDSE